MTRSAFARASCVCDAAVLAFAGWTVLAHSAVWLGVGLAALQWAAGGAAVLAGASAWVWRARLAATAIVDPLPAPQAESIPQWQRIAVLALAGGCGASYWSGIPATALWLVASALAAVLTCRELLVTAPATSVTPATPRSPATPPDGSRARSAEGRRGFLILAALSLSCVCLALAASRPDQDDAFYLNLAVAAADHPDAPLLAQDTLHGIPGIPLALPVYKVHSLELLEAAASRVLGLPVLDIAHVLVPALAALLLPFGCGRLLRLLVPDRWILCVGVTIAYFVFAGGPMSGWANFGIVRLHQGKGMLLTLALPLIAAYAIEYARGPSIARWVRLAAAQVAGVGLSATALWLAPLVAGIALAGGAYRETGKRRGLSLRVLASGLGASGYVVVLALGLRAATETAFRDAVAPSPELALASAELAEQAIRVVVGDGPMGALVWLSALGAWSLASTTAARRFCAFIAVGWLVLWNPYWGAWIAAHVTSAPTYWRALWLLPIPILSAVVLTGPLAFAPRRRALATALAAVLCAGVFLLAPTAWTLSRANHVTLGWPGWKVPGRALDAAIVLTADAGPEERVLAPRHVAAWIPALHDAPSPLVVRPAYLPLLSGVLDEAELQARVALFRLVSGERRAAHADVLLERALDDSRLTGVCLTRTAARWTDLTQSLVRAGFQKVHENAEYQVWRRESS